jgi:beta-mannanase
VNQAAIRYHLPAIYFSFEHESSLRPKHTGLGSPAQSIQAWDHIHQLAATMHLDWNDGGRIHWVWIQLHQTFVPVDQRPGGGPILGGPTTYWPGRNEVDIVAADGYSHPGCSGHAGPMTPQTLFAPVLSFAHQNGGLPVFITEWGSTAVPSGQAQTGFIGQMQAFVAANPEIVAVLYWNSPGASPRCNFSVDTHPASVSALATMAHSAGLQGRLG